MKLAVVASPSTLMYTLPSNYHMALAHLCRDYPDYRDFYKGAVSSGREVILDNGAAEFGTAMRLDELLPIVHDLKPTVWVMPDTVMEEVATLWHFNMALTHPNLPTPFMVVPQGRNVEEWMNCFDHMVTHEALPSNTWIGISKFCLHYTTRVSILDFVKNRFAEMQRANPKMQRVITKVHLLGLEDPLELVEVNKAHSWVYGCDTSTPIAMGLAGIHIADYKAKVDMQWEPFHIDNTESMFIRENARILRSLAEAQ